MATGDMLRDLGYTVVEASSGSQALATLRAGAKIDLVLSDYLMPGLTGAALIHEMRDAGLRTPTLLVTGYSAAGEDVPADVPRLTKPFRQADLAARLDELLERASTNKGRSHLRAVE